MSGCNLGRETTLAIGEGLVKNIRLQTLKVGNNLIQLNGIREIVRACYENSKLVLKHVDFQSNDLCDQAGQLLLKGFKFISTIESLNFRANSLGQESGDVLLFMTKENQMITKVVLDLNMVMPNTIAAIQARCKSNKQVKKTVNVPQIKKEIRSLRRARGKSGDFPIDKLKKQLSR